MFVQPFTVECDYVEVDRRECTNEETVQARSQAQANKRLEELGWKATCGNRGYKHYCPDHKDKH